MKDAAIIRGSVGKLDDEQIGHRQRIVRQESQHALPSRVAPQLNSLQMPSDGQLYVAAGKCASRAWAFFTSFALAVEMTTALLTTAVAANNRMECCNKERSPRGARPLHELLSSQQPLGLVQQNLASVKGS